ncbi:MAG: glutamate-5-semialdehyde dehydrogenase [Dysgonamonadaceae bacterium]|nr:glutamate-5-semialdehyde dehydrogenase [Dysgonamonadaceae bacterium]MDD3900928.1 glutamate-5-semialdehyde dehydrogenase [Dysgonamonadaceae bacterium]MDD4398338.1 glutamate-5-semialdehyde dehydrogenase [Dysgonamonadaceae bacterium]
MIDSKQKNNVLLRLSEIVLQNKTQIIEANTMDKNALINDDTSMEDRLKVDDAKIEGMSRSLKEVAQMDEPVGKLLYEFTREDGLHIENRTVPFGTILIIYESRPDVTIEAAATAFKAGNRILLKGGKEAFHTNSLLTQLWKKAFSENNVDEGYVEYLHLTHNETQKLIVENSNKVDLIIPRGGENLIKFVVDNATVPVIISGRGNNFLYVDQDSDFQMAVRIILNGKSRISVCNALDKVLIDGNLPNLKEKVDLLVKKLKTNNIEVLGDNKTTCLNADIVEIDDDKILFEEFLAPKIYLTTVQGLNDAINIINKYCGKHSSTIVTNNKDHADTFMEQIDCAAVYHNASTRFTDGGQFGVGGEIAISTQKLHFMGPLGAQQLVTNKWFIYGKGHTRD